MINPSGEYNTVFSANVLIVPNYNKKNDFNEQKKQLHNIYLTIHIPETADLGRYRIKVENFYEGKLWFSENIDNDFFYVEKLEFGDLIFTDNYYITEIKNPSSAEVPIVIIEKKIDKESFVSHKEIIPASTTRSISVQTDLAFIQYANNETVVLNARKNSLILRNQKFFWREEDEETIFVFDPRAEEKRNFFLRGHAKFLWENANGLNRLVDIDSSTDDSNLKKMIEKGLIKEINHL